MSGNVIDFALAKRKKDETERSHNFKNKNQEFDEAEEENIADFAVSVICDTLEVMSELGYDIRDNPKSIKDVFAAIESIRGLIHRVREQEHPFHVVTNTMFSEIPEAMNKTEEELLHSFIENMELELD